MKAFTDIRPLSPEQLDRLHAAARRRAEDLRREAIDDFWRGSNALLSNTMTRAPLGAAPGGAADTARATANRALRTVIRVRGAMQRTQLRHRRESAPVAKPGSESLPPGAGLNPR